MGYLEDGILTLDDIQLPDEKRFQEGSVAIIECAQRIPCNPCVESCAQGAITIKGSINEVPVMDFKKCTGCGLCLSKCPGLAIFLVDLTSPGGQATVGLPYEFIPLPEKGEEVILLNRAGEPVGSGEVNRVRNSKSQDRTPIVSIIMEKKLALSVRHFKRKRQF